MKTFYLTFACMFGFVCSIHSQDLAKEIAKLDFATGSAILGQVSEQHTIYYAGLHQKKLAELQKSGVQIIMKDTLITVNKPLKIAFAWPVSAGLKAVGKTLIEREPFVITLYPGKNEKGADSPQKWEISYATGTVKATP